VAAKRLNLRRPDTCVICGAGLPAGTAAAWDRDTRTVTCIPCLEPLEARAQPDPGPSTEPNRPGASLGREYERRRANRERRVRDAHPHIGGFLLAWNGEPQHEKAFRLGEQGELEVAAAIERAVAQVDGIVLHNRSMPGRCRDIDHIAIVPSGIYVIDAKAVTGMVEVRTRWLKPPLLYVGGRDQTKFLDGLDRQVAAVRQALSAEGDGSVPIQAALCFTKADLPLLRTVEARGHLLLYRKRLAKRLVADGPIEAPQRTLFATRLARLLPPA
jgi:hypothetical protein